MKWANKEVKHYLALWLKERGILLVKSAFNIIKFFTLLNLVRIDLAVGSV